MGVQISTPPSSLDFNIYWSMWYGAYENSSLPLPLVSPLFIVERDPRWLQCPRQLETRTRILSEDFLYLRRTLIGSFQPRQYRNNKGSNSRVLQVAVSNHFVLLHFFSSRCLKFNQLNQKKNLVYAINERIVKSNKKSPRILLLKFFL